MKLKNGLFICLTALTLSGCWETENGEKIGVIVKISKEGSFIGTWEGELIRGGMNNGSGSFGKSFHFTVEYTELLQTLNTALDSQKEVKIRYHKEALAFPWRSDSDNYFLDNVRIMK